MFIFLPAFHEWNVPTFFLQVSSWDCFHQNAYQWYHPHDLWIASLVTVSSCAMWIVNLFSHSITHMDRLVDLTFSSPICLFNAGLPPTPFTLRPMTSNLVRCCLISKGLNSSRMTLSLSAVEFLPTSLGTPRFLCFLDRLDFDWLPTTPADRKEVLSRFSADPPLPLGWGCLAGIGKDTKVYVQPKIASADFLLLVPKPTPLHRPLSYTIQSIQQSPAHSCTIVITLAHIPLRLLEKKKLDYIATIARNHPLSLYIIIN